MARPEAHAGGTRRPASRVVARAAVTVLALSHVLGGLASVRLLVAPTSLPSPWPRPGSDDVVLVRAWAVTWLVLSVVLLVVLLTASRRGEPWARVVMLAAPAVWLAHYGLVPATTHNLALAGVTLAAVIALWAPRRS